MKENHLSPSTFATQEQDVCHRSLWSRGTSVCPFSIFHFSTMNLMNLVNLWSWVFMIHLPGSRRSRNQMEPISQHFFPFSQQTGHVFEVYETHLQGGPEGFGNGYSHRGIDFVDLISFWLILQNHPKCRFAKRPTSDHSRTRTTADNRVGFQWSSHLPPICTSRQADGEISTSHVTISVKKRQVCAAVLVATAVLGAVLLAMRPCRNPV